MRELLSAASPSFVPGRVQAAHAQRSGLQEPPTWTELICCFFIFHISFFTILEKYTPSILKRMQLSLPEKSNTFNFN